jgi:L-amino acid N-acyltransferase YncA
MEFRSLVEQFRFSSRMARPADHSGIVRLCKRAVGSHDYAIRLVKEMIKERRLFVVFSPDGDLIGMSSFTPVFDKSGWLGMARTDPKWRGKGVAQFLQRTIARYAKKKGIRKLRFFVLSTNIRSLRAARKGGFKAVAQFSHVSCSLNKVRKSLIDAVENEVAKPVNTVSILKSPYVSKMNRYIRYGFYMVKATASNLGYIDGKKELFRSNGSSFILTQTEKTHAEFGILTGRIKDTLIRILKYAKEKKLRFVDGVLPHDYHMIKVSQSLGFHVDSWGKHLLLFEKII